MLTPQQIAIIERGRRLIDLRQCPGYVDLVRISEKLIEKATEDLISYDGWDKEQAWALQVKANAAKSHHEALLTAIEETVRIAINHRPDAPREDSGLNDQQREEMRSFLVGVN